MIGSLGSVGTLISEFTFETWTDADFHRAPEGAYVIKGRTNSRKSHWNTHMFAATKREAIEVAGRLTADQMIMQQGLVYRKYEPLVTYEIGIHGQRFTNEWRFFFSGTSASSTAGTGPSRSTRRKPR